MLSSVLKSRRAIHVNIAIMRTFVRLREILATHKHLARKLDVLDPCPTSTAAHRVRGAGRQVGASFSAAGNRDTLGLRK